MILAYVKAFSVTREPLYLEIAERTASYVLWEMTSPEGGFYSAQDADSDGEEENTTYSRQRKSCGSWGKRTAMPSALILTSHLSATSTAGVFPIC